MSQSSSKIAEESRQKRNVSGNILSINASTDRPLVQKIRDILQKEQEAASKGYPSLDGFVLCFLIVQSVYKSSGKSKFRVKLEWTGLEVKQEVQRLYEIPTQFQVLIINDKVVSDQQPISQFQFKPVGQIVYIFVIKKKIDYVGSGIRIRDILEKDDKVDADMDPEEAAGGYETVPALVYDPTMDVDADSVESTTISPGSSRGNKKKRKSKKR